MLLHGPTRTSLGINLTNSVVVLDEAHNIVDAVNGMHSTVLSRRQVRDASSDACLRVAWFSLPVRRIASMHAAD
jgi:Rad3-related DNA helicase